VIAISVGIVTLIGIAVGGAIWLAAYHIGWMHGHERARRSRPAIGSAIHRSARKAAPTAVALKSV
jgi:hypothetical protein